MDPQETTPIVRWAEPWGANQGVSTLLLPGVTHREPMPSPKRLLERVVGGKYAIFEYIDSGSFGDVYRAHGPDGVVTVKVLRHIHVGDLEARDRFREEGRLMLGVSHPNIVPTLDAGVDETTGEPLFYLVMEHFDGVTLQHAMDLRSERLPWLFGPTALSITILVLDALAFLHEQGIVHRDVKPSNVLLALKDARGREDESATTLSGWLNEHLLQKERFLQNAVMLSDFSIARKAEADGKHAFTVVAGTPFFMAPEQFRHTSRPDPKMDVWAVTVMFYYMLTGRLPFVGETADDIRRCAESGTPPVSILEIIPKLRSIPWGNRLWEIILLGLARDPEDRPDARTMAQHLRGP